MYRILVNGSTVHVVIIVILVYCPRSECILTTIIVPFDFGQLNVTFFYISDWICTTASAATLKF